MHRSGISLLRLMFTLRPYQADFLGLFQVTGVFRTLEDVDDPEVGKADLLDPAVANAKDGDVERPLEERDKRHELLQRGSFVELEGFEAHIFSVDRGKAGEEG